MLDRATCEAAFRDAIDECDPRTLVRVAIESGILERAGRRDRPRLGLAIGKAALAMARGLGPVARGVAVTNADDGLPVPRGWHVTVASHPEPDARSLAAGDEVIDLVASATDRDLIVALVSGGASALVERLLPGVTLDGFRAEIRAVMASGAPIRELNRARTARSAIKGGKLAAMAVAPIVTLAISDVVGDELAVIGSGPTILAPMRAGDEAVVIAGLDRFAKAVAAGLGRRSWPLLDNPAFRNVDDVPITGDVAAAADRWAAHVGVRIGFGEPTVQLPPDHGDGGRAQQLALELAWRLRGTQRSALVAGSDGIDGPPPRGRPAPAGAFVDGTTWGAIFAAGVDPDRALVRRDAGTALAAAGALFITGPTGINHADVVIIG